MPIVPEAFEYNLFALNQIQEFARAGAQLLLVLIHRPGNAIRGESELQHNRVDSQQHQAGLWQAQQHRLMPGSVAAGLKQGQAGQDLGITIEQAVMQGWMIPVSTCGGKTWMSAACQ